MKKFVGYGAVAVLGFILGAVASYLYCDKQLKEYIANLDAETEEMIEKIENGDFDEVDEYNDEQPMTREQMAEISREFYEREFCNEDDVTLRPMDIEKEERLFEQHERETEEQIAAEEKKISNDYRDDEEWQAMVEATTKNYDRNRKRGYLITGPEYYETCEIFDKLHLTYYEGDNVLTNIDDSIIDHEECMMALGDTPEEYFSQLDSGEYQSEDPSMGLIYVRNNRLKIDYEVYREPGTYREIVLGE